MPSRSTGNGRQRSSGATSRGWREVLGGWMISGELHAHRLPMVAAISHRQSHQPIPPASNFGTTRGGSGAHAAPGTRLPAAHSVGSERITQQQRRSGEWGSGALHASNRCSRHTVHLPIPQPGSYGLPDGQQPFVHRHRLRELCGSSFTGPGYFVLMQTSASRLPPMKILGEGARLEIRANFINLFNKLNLWCTIRIFSTPISVRRKTPWARASSRCRLRFNF